MNGYVVILVKDEFFDLSRPVQTTFGQQVVYETTEKTARPHGNFHPEVFSPAKKRNDLLR
jgi:hypothetical protein